MMIRSPLWWHGPFWSGSGYGSEASNFMLSLYRSGLVHQQDLWASHHGDVDRKSVRDAMAENDMSDLNKMIDQVNTTVPAIILCHSLPPNWWTVGQQEALGGQDCPPDPRVAAYVYTVGRTMFETDRSGVRASKIHILPEGVNTTWFDPDIHTPVQLPQGTLVFGSVGTTISSPITVSSHAGMIKLDHVGAASFASGSNKGEAEEVPVGSNKGGAGEESLGISRGSAVEEAPSSGKGGAEVETSGSMVLSGPYEEQGDGNLGFAQRAALKLQHQHQIVSITETPSRTAGVAEGMTHSHREAPPFRKRHAAQSLSLRKHHAAQSLSLRKRHAAQSLSLRKRHAAQSLFLLTLFTIRFLSTFKWEPRKGWDILLEAYMLEFDAEKDKVELYIITKPFAGGADFKQYMHSWAQQVLLPKISAASSGSPAPDLVLGSSGSPAPDLVLGSSGSPAPDLVLGSSGSPAPDLVLGSSGSPAPDPVLGSSGSPAPAKGGVSGSPHAALRTMTKVRPKDTNIMSGTALDRLLVKARRIDSVGPSLIDLPPQHMQLVMPTSVDGLSYDADDDIDEEVVYDSSSSDDGNMVKSWHDKAMVVTDQKDKQDVDQDVDQGAEEDSPLPAEKSEAEVEATTTVSFQEIASQLPKVFVISHLISDQEFPRYYKAVDAFVLPTRGEGWGRPQVEAMSMGLPVISTNWSGITAFLDEKVGYPIKVDGLVTVQDKDSFLFQGLKWAQPSIEHTRVLMRHVYNEREEARQKGIEARRRMVQNFSSDVVAELLLSELIRIDDYIPAMD
ncbi:hypothetical protein CEUSTIGMA_g3296.t1 [Chlamydomonas eustigma]|uniref:Glycosyl transferase family 1 domain-containing protein n=1 Tax=Chlamydomonas eustigma TaxID=1157962 RepID=A0A250WYD5_9CHLO|nr:hypothetical protein CEUSTIGMA_g3296.t1 [Chlamydomonas eustigma]|eukprot:GAX75853.1 hypothetical protein CEUSTIGMA_g3296.t1 [Chlamydomonas eustigma]